MKSFDWNGTLAEAQQGSVRARDQLFSALLENCRRILHYRMRGASDSDKNDVLQTTMLTVTEKFDSIRDNPQYFALSVLQNKLHHYYRSIKVKHSRFADSPQSSLERGEEFFDKNEPAAEVDLLAQAEAGDLHKRIQVALRQLSPFCRELFLALLQGWNVDDAWARCFEYEPKLSRGTFNKRVFDCRRRLRALTGSEVGNG